MKRLVIIVLIFFASAFFVPINLQVVHAKDIKISIETPSHVFEFMDDELINKVDLTAIKVPLSSHARNGGLQEKRKIAKLMEKQGFSEKTIMNFLFVGLEQKINEIKGLVSVHAVEPKLVYDKLCKTLIVTDSYVGDVVDEESLYKVLYKSFKTDLKVNAKTKIIKEHPRLNKRDAQKFAAKKSKFATYFDSGNVSRASNICEALKAFDGKVLMPNEMLSFNETTGKRNAENGYLPAKIISGGKYIEGYGGGVCQASTTLYNAALIAGLEIIEVHQHSLKVGYVDASFDAMVNIGSSDLKMKNNYSYPLIISAGAANGMASVTIFGKQNEYDINRKSEIVKVINAPKTEVIEMDVYNGLPLRKGEQVVESSSHNGLVSNGYLEYYKSGKLLKTEKIRSNHYNPSAGKIIIGTAN